MTDPIKHITRLQKDLEKLHNDYTTQLRQEQSRSVQEMQNKFNALDDHVIELIKNELSVHLELLHGHIQRIEAKLNLHFGK